MLNKLLNIDINPDSIQRLVYKIKLLQLLAIRSNKSQTGSLVNPHVAKNPQLQNGCQFNNTFLKDNNYGDPDHVKFQKNFEPLKEIRKFLRTFH